MPGTRFALLPRLLLCASALAVLPGCTPRLREVLLPPRQEEVSARPAILFVHGFYGSALREKGRGRRVFYTGREILFGTDALSLFQKELGTPAGPELEVEGLLGTVPVVPALYAVDVYAELVERLEREFPGHQVLPVVYDWRDDLSKPVAKVDTLVQALKAKGAPSITLVAHSMGGRVAAYYLAYGNVPPEKAVLNWRGAAAIRKAVFFGTPFRGSMISLRCFEKGSGLPGWAHLLPAETMGSFPALYELMPPGNAKVLNFAGLEEKVDLLSPELWWQKGFGLFRRADLDSQTRANRRKFVTQQLAKARLWSDLLALPAAGSPPPPKTLAVLNVVGTRQPTLAGAYLDPPSGRLLFDPSDLRAANLPEPPIFAPGDETVTTASAAIPQALEGNTRLVLTPASHTKLFLDENVEAEYKKFLTD